MATSSALLTFTPGDQQEPEACAAVLRLVRTESKCRHGMCHHVRAEAYAVPPLPSTPLNHLHPNPTSSQVGKGRGSASGPIGQVPARQGKGRGRVFQQGRAGPCRVWAPPQVTQASQHGVARPSPPLPLG